ncbi:MAG: VWA domain-containing protein [Chloroflexota bacterium]
MGYGSYSQVAHEALLRQRSNIPAEQVFKQVKCHPLMDPKGVKLRESRDAADHPESQAIVFALDVSGSMGQIPRLMATQQLPNFMKVLMGCEIRDPQVLFMAIGNATSDLAPLQVGQFESTAELMDQWLTWTYLEGRGGGVGESYDLGFYFLATHTEMDCMVKRNKKGYLFMTGDETPFPALSKHIVEGIVGDKLDEDIPMAEVIAEVQKTYVPFFIIPDRTRAKQCERQWRDLLGDHVLVLENPVDVCYVAAGAILINEGRASSVKELAELLDNAGMPSDRRNSALRTLTPFAEVILNGKNSSNWFSRFVKGS